MNPYAEMSREELLTALEMFAKNWLAHDGCWFLAAEAEHGMATAIPVGRAGVGPFQPPVEARRIIKGYGLPEAGGLEALERALSLRMYSVINEQHVEWSEDRRRLRFYMDVCRVQETRRRKGMEDFPCKSVGVCEFTAFAKAVDPRIVTRCLHCPPEAPEGLYCAWEFELAEADGAAR